MTSLNTGGCHVGDLDDDGNVIKLTRFAPIIVGHVHNDGKIYDAKGQMKGWVDDQGNVLSKSNRQVGTAYSDGSVTDTMGGTGSVNGSQTLLAGGALVLFFDLYRHEPQDVPWWVVVAGLVALLLAIIFLLVTAEIWAVMLLLAALSALYAAKVFVKSVDAQTVASLEVIEIKTIFGKRKAIVHGFPATLLLPYPNMFLVLSPSLVYGLIAVLTFVISSAKNGQLWSNLILSMIAYVFGALTSAVLGQWVLNKRLGFYLIKMREGSLPATAPAAIAKLLDDLAKAAKYCGILLAALVLAITAGAAWVSTKAAPVQMKPSGSATATAVTRHVAAHSAEPAAQENKTQPSQTSPVPPTTGANVSRLQEIVTRQALTADDIKGLSDWDLTVLRNSVYARHGYKFHRRDLATYFGRQTWYVSSTPDQSAVYKQFSTIERHNVEMLASYQASHSGQR
ncbi:MAG: YARHG domain-containing protein [Capsulimonadaceae bacterium]|nr:YARHG domain-containing protein [Capsulimonadaceae bacterium]